MPELNWFCKECKRINISCDGSTNPVYSNCVYRKHWLNRNNKVRVIKSNYVGLIQDYDWCSSSYFVKFDNGKVFPYKRDELKEAVM